MDSRKPKFSKVEAEEGDVMLPFMSLLLIIIPVLISNIAFYHFKSISINVPGMAPDTNDEKEQKKPPNKDKNYILQLNISEENLNLDLIDEDTGEVVKKNNVASGKKAAEEVWKNIIQFRSKFKKLNSMLVSVSENIKYENLINILEQCRQPDTSADVTKELLLVLLPKG